MTGLDIIIVNWNAGRQLRDCLESIVDTSRCGFELNRVVLVDNASSDRSVDALEILDIPLTIVQNDANRGFAVACNQGAKGSCSDYLLFLNPDTRLFRNSLVKPLAYMEHQDNRCVGIVGIQLIDEKGKISRNCARFPTLGRFFVKMIGLDRLSHRLFLSHFMKEWDHGQTREVDQVMGAFFLTRRTLFEDIGGFDERFFVYMEDVDYSLRIYKRNWKTIYLTEAQAFHKGGGTSQQIKATRLFYSLRSRIQYGYKHFNCFSATFLMMGTVFIEPLSRLVMAAYQGSGWDVLETLKAYWRLLVSLPTLILSKDGKQTP